MSREPSESSQGLIIHEGHKSEVYSVAFSPDGKSVVSGSNDKTIRIWDSRKPFPIGAPLRGHSESVRSVSYSPLGNTIASGSWDFTVRLWDTNTGQQVEGPMEGHTAIVDSVAFSPDANLIASCSADRTIRLWNAESRKAASDPFKGHTASISSVAFSSDGTHLVSSSDDKKIRIWDVERGVTVVGPLEGHTDGVRSVAFSPDGSQIISGSYDHTLRLWDAHNGRMIGEPYIGHTYWVTSVAFSPNGNYVASGAADRTYLAPGALSSTVRIWDVRTGHQIDGPFEKYTRTVYSVAFSPCGKRIASGSHDKAVTIWTLSGIDSDPEDDPHSSIQDDTKVESVELIGQHMSIQDMFDLLLRHGCIDLTSQMDQGQNPVLVSGGGFGDIWIGKMHSGDRVAVKTWRASLIEQCDYKSLKRAMREIHLWSRMKHENVHELMGVIMLQGHSLGMVSEWMENGNVHEYMRKNPKFGKHQLCIQVASGLAYMHQHNAVHGDLKALNVLISSGGIAKLTDFGLSVMSETSLAFSSTSAQSGSIRWAAPELISEAGTKTKQSDVYALAMTILEIFTGDVPYPQCQWDFQVMNKVLQGVLPTRPTDRLKDVEHDNRVWELLVNCWNRDPDARPPAEEIRRSLVRSSADI